MPTSEAKKNVPGAWQVLLDVLKADWMHISALVSDQDILDILLALSAPPDLRGVCEVAANIVEMKNTLDMLASGKSIRNVNLCIRVCEEIVRCKANIVARLPKAVMHARAKSASIRKRLIKTYTRYPLYGCLWHQAALTDFQQQFRLLQAYLLNYFVRFGHEANTSHPYVWAKSVRILSEEGATQKSILEHLPNTALAPVIYRERLMDAQVKFSGNRTAVAHLGDLIRMLDVLVSGIPPLGHDREHAGEGGGGGKPVRGSMPDVHVELAAYEVELPNGGRRQIVHWQPLFVGPGRRAHLTKRGTSPTDEIPPFDEISVGVSRVDSGCYSIRDYILQTKDAQRAMARSNLALQGRWESMNHHDLTQLAQALRSSDAEPAPFSIPSKALLWLALYAAREPEFFARVRVVAKGTSASSSPVTATYDRTDGLLWVPAGSHLPYRVLDENQRRVARPLQESLGLPLPPPPREALDAHLSRRESAGHGELMLFRPDEIRRGIREIGQFLAGLNSEHGTRLTLTRITRSLHEHLLQVPGGGHVEAGLITGYFPAYSRNPAFYTHVKESRLRSLYRQACAQIAVNASCDPFPVVADDATPPSESGLGSGIVPTREAVRDSVQWLRKGLQCARGAPLDVRAMLLHNHLVAHVLAMLLYATGHRDTANPFSRIDEIDLKKRIAVVSDKDRNDYFGAHPVRLPQVCLDQLRAYFEHLKALADHLRLTSPGLAGEVSGLGRIRHFKQRVAHQRLKEESLPLFFWLEKKHRNTRRTPAEKTASSVRELYVARAVTPSALSSFLGAVSALPENGNRHYLRTQLRESFCPDEVIDPNNGHWLQGGEPGGRHSCHSQRICNEILDGHLSVILKEDGWTVERGWHAN